MQRAPGPELPGQAAARTRRDPSRRSSRLLDSQPVNSLIVFVGGSCYGIVASVVKLAYDAGFTSAQVMASQSFVAFVLLATIVVGSRILGFGPKPLTWRQRAKFTAMGFVTAGTSLFYYFALTVLDASVAITLLFQFTWMGLVFQSATTRKAPPPSSIIAALVILVGTLFASGVVGNGSIGRLDPFGLVCGLLSAVCCAAYMYLTGRVEVDLPAPQRSMWASLGMLIVSLIRCPDFFWSGAWTDVTGRFGLVLGLVGFVTPILLFAVSCPKLSPGIATIMASSELPVSVLCSVAILSESIGGLRVAGIVAILVGVAISQVPGRKARAESLADTENHTAPDPETTPKRPPTRTEDPEGPDTAHRP